MTTNQPPAETDRQTSDATVDTAIIQTAEPRYGLSDMQIDALMRPISQKRVKQNKKRFSYVEAWDVKAALIRVFGFAGFSTELLEWKELRAVQVQQKSDNTKTNWEISVAATVRVTIHQTGAIYTEAAVGTNSQPEYGAAFDTALKSAESYALKRACVQLGTQFGMSLYDGQLSDVVRIVLAPGQERNLPKTLTPEDKQKAQELIDRAFTVDNGDRIEGTHEDRLVEDMDLLESKREQFENESSAQQDQ